MRQRHLYRLALAFLISIGWNVILFAVNFSVDPRQQELSRIQRRAVGLFSPADALADGFRPSHGGPQIPALILSSVLIYALATWLVLTLPEGWRRRA